MPTDKAGRKGTRDSKSGVGCRPRRCGLRSACSVPARHDDSSPTPPSTTIRPLSNFLADHPGLALFNSLLFQLLVPVTFLNSMISLKIARSRLSRSRCSAVPLRRPAFVASPPPATSHFPSGEIAMASGKLSL
jgi:hypothetical protein